MTEIEKEQEAWRSINALFRNKEKGFEKKLAVSRAETEKEREEKEKYIPKYNSRILQV